ncbi:glycoside hydrolase family 15 protein [Halorussus ruber]|uniref:glycoside hydrolase family 15 protein n=1 Tax=Halorussus ruber TaxID=1126238 RepID=UPI001B2FF383|nr:glycoside hydrolase family 15 protein [Halorussus ruber]
MTDDNRFSRRTVLKGIGGTAAGSALLRSVSTPASAGEHYPDSDKDAIVSAPDGAGQNVLATLNQYPGVEGNDWYGTLIEDTSAFRRDVEHVRDVHTMLWDADLGQTLDVRNDAAGSEVTYESSTVPEVHVHNWFQFDSGYWADLYQDVLVTADKPALLVQNNVQFDRANDHTLYTLVNPAIDEYDSRGEGDSGYYTTASGYDCIVANDGSWYLAYAQKRPSTGKTTFDGHRVGVEGDTSGSDKSAWHDIYGENDGYIDRNNSASGNVDSGVGLYVGGATDVTWLTAIGFGKSESEAIDNATAALDNGYATERSNFESAWTDWHASVSSGPTGDATADAMYEKSLTSLKCAQDPRGPMIAGAFEPGSEEYTYVWPRDQVVVIQSLLSAGATTEAKEALSWLDSAQITTDTYDDRNINRNGTWWQNYYVDGSSHWEALQLDQVGGPHLRPLAGLAGDRRFDGPQRPLLDVEAGRRVPARLRQRLRLPEETPRPVGGDMGLLDRGHRGRDCGPPGDGRAGRREWRDGLRRRLPEQGRHVGIELRRLLLQDRRLSRRPLRHGRQPRVHRESARRPAPRRRGVHGLLAVERQGRHERRDEIDRPKGRRQPVEGRQLPLCGSVPRGRLHAERDGRRRRMAPLRGLRRRSALAERRRFERGERLRLRPRRDVDHRGRTPPRARGRRRRRPVELQPPVESGDVPPAGRERPARDAVRSRAE